jgi:hypothetical protein
MAKRTTRRRLGVGVLAGMLAVSLLAALAGCAPVRYATIIDWVNMIRFRGITYLANVQAGRDLQADDLGTRFDTVRFRLDGNVHDANYQTHDGDAAFLDAGTPVYRVLAYAPTFRLAARQDGRIVLFEADTNPQAKIGADLLDIGGKVSSITVTGDTTTQAVATISDSHLIVTLVSLLLAAPVDQSERPGDAGVRYFLAFHLTDGTQVMRLYLPQSHEVARGIIVPDAFVAALAAALG